MLGRTAICSFLRGASGLGAGITISRLQATLISTVPKRMLKSLYEGFC